MIHRLHGRGMTSRGIRLFFNSDRKNPEDARPRFLNRVHDGFLTKIRIVRTRKPVVSIVAFLCFPEKLRAKFRDDFHGTLRYVSQPFVPTFPSVNPPTKLKISHPPFLGDGPRSHISHDSCSCHQARHGLPISFLSRNPTLRQ